MKISSIQKIGESVLMSSFSHSMQHIHMHQQQSGCKIQSWGCCNAPLARGQF